MIDFDLIKYITGFFIVAIAAYEIAKFFQKKIHFPLITGLILTGILAGTSFLNFIPEDALSKLNFFIEMALAVIAFSAGAELHLEGLRSRMKSIKWMTIGQLLGTFIIATALIYFLSDFIPFMKNIKPLERLGIALLFGTIFVARSPSSAIAIINEMRAQGPFTKTAMGVTVVIDVLVILLFSAVFAYTKSITQGEGVDAMFFIILIVEIVISIAIGFLYGKFINYLLSLKIGINIKAILIVLTGYSIYVFNHFLYDYSTHHFNHHFEIEPLLTAIMAAFYVVNYTKFRYEFEQILEKSLPFILVMFFALTGASLSVQTLLSVFSLALIFFILRILTLIIGGLFGVYMAKDDNKYYLIAWMPYVTQAGVAVGLAALIGKAFPQWGHQFETIIIAIIVLNQILGPPLFKWAIKYVGEAHQKKTYQPNTPQHKAVIFSLDSMSLALARLLKQKAWQVKIVSTQKKHNINDIEILQVEEFDKNNLSKIDLENPDSIILLRPDDKKNYEIAEWIYETIGSPNMITRLESGSYAGKFKEIGVKVIEPTAAMVNLLDHLVRAPEATNILLGLDETQDTIDVEVRNHDLVGLHIRDLHLPQDVIILSLKRRGNTVITHGYTQLRMGDILTFVGSKDSLEQVRSQFEYS